MRLLGVLPHQLFDPLTCQAHDPASCFDYLHESVIPGALYFVNLPFSHPDPFIAKACDSLIYEDSSSFVMMGDARYRNPAGPPRRVKPVADEPNDLCQFAI
jgi:hypothetical protein